jgi:hypothetical protein
MGKGVRSELTDTDYDALFAVMQADMPRAADLTRNLPEDPGAVRRHRRAQHHRDRHRDRGEQRPATADRCVSRGAESEIALTRKLVLDQRIEQPECFLAPRFDISIIEVPRASPRSRERSASASYFQRLRPALQRGSILFQGINVRGRRRTESAADLGG